jgi:SET domain
MLHPRIVPRSVKISSWLSGRTTSLKDHVCRSTHILSSPHVHNRLQSVQHRLHLETRFCSNDSFDVKEVFSNRAIQKFNIDTATQNDVLVNIQKDTSDMDKGWALYAKTDIIKGQLVFRGKSLKTYRDDEENDGFIDKAANSRRGSHTVQTGWKTHVVMDLPAILVNHSCNANVGIQENVFGAYDFVALRDLRKGEEVLWDYETSEYWIFGQFHCSCGAPNCRGTLQGFHANGQAVLELYGKNRVAPYLFRDPTKE